LIFSLKYQLDNLFSKRFKAF